MYPLVNLQSVRVIKHPSLCLTSQKSLLKLSASLSVYYFCQTSYNFRYIESETLHPLPTATPPPNLLTSHLPLKSKQFLKSTEASWCSSEAAGFHRLLCPRWTTLPMELRKENTSTTLDSHCSYQKHKHLRLTLFLPKVQLFAETHFSVCWLLLVNFHSDRMVWFDHCPVLLLLVGRFVDHIQSCHKLIKPNF